VTSWVGAFHLLLAPTAPWGLQGFVGEFVLIVTTMAVPPGPRWRRLVDPRRGGAAASATRTPTTRRFESSPEQDGNRGSPVGPACDHHLVRVRAQELLTVMRPLVIELERALQRLLKAGLAIPTRPVPRIESAEDGAARQWIEAEVDFWRLRLGAMSALESSGNLFVAEAMIARALGLESPTQSGNERPWTPQGQVVDVFLEDYLRTAYGDEGNLHMAQTLSAVENPADAALAAQVERLARFLSSDTFTGRLIVPLGGVRLSADTFQLEHGVSVVPFVPALRDEIWRIAGWGSIATQPLQSTEFFGVAQAIIVEICGARLGGWDWAAGQADVERARLALLLCGAASVRTGLSWLRLDEPFESYLSRLGVGSGLVRQALAPHVSAPTELPEDLTARVPEIYEQLATVPEIHPLALALRRLSISSDRSSPEDRLIDNWIAFEALFTRDGTTEVRFRAALRIARYVGRDVDERRVLFQGLKRAYDWRSYLVHGGGADQAKAKLGPLDEAVALSERALRAALREWLVRPPSSDLHEIDERFLA